VATLVSKDGMAAPKASCQQPPSRKSTISARPELSESSPCARLKSVSSPLLRVCFFVVLLFVFILVQLVQPLLPCVSVCSFRPMCGPGISYVTLRAQPDVQRLYRTRTCMAAAHTHIPVPWVLPPFPGRLGGGSCFTRNRPGRWPPSSVPRGRRRRKAASRPSSGFLRPNLRLPRHSVH